MFYDALMLLVDNPLKAFCVPKCEVLLLHTTVKSHMNHPLLVMWIRKHSETLCLTKTRTHMFTSAATSTNHNQKHLPQCHRFHLFFYSCDDYFIHYTKPSFDKFISYWPSDQSYVWHIQLHSLRVFYSQRTFNYPQPLSPLSPEQDWSTIDRKPYLISWPITEVGAT